jgi:outer membrane biosynthesis protein TonB
MTTERSPSPHVAERDSRSSSRRHGVVATTLVCSVLAAAGTGGAAVASPAPQTGPTVTVTALQTPGELAYVATVHRQLGRAKRYPTGREASLSRPSGTTTVWVDVARDGHPVGRGISRSSGSGLLDWTATNLVGRTNYPAFPVDAWAGGTQQRFVVSYRFVGQAGAPGNAQLEVAVAR